jgi:hypothetical protein
MDQRDQLYIVCINYRSAILSKEYPEIHNEQNNHTNNYLISKTRGKSKSSINIDYKCKYRIRTDVPRVLLTAILLFSMSIHNTNMIIDICLLQTMYLHINIYNLLSV